MIATKSLSESMLIFFIYKISGLVRLWTQYNTTYEIVDNSNSI